MGTKVSPARWRVPLAASALLAALIVALASTHHLARAGVPVAPLSELRIEGPRANLDPGTWYAIPEEEVRRSRSNGCTHRDGTITVSPSALSITETASDASRGLPPVRVRPDDFGLFVCEIGGLVGRPFDDPAGFSGWIYWLDFAGGTQAAENEMLSGDEQVLWVFSDFGDANLNTGEALELTGVPPYDPDGAFTVQVSEHAYAGTATPLAGATIKGAESFDDLGGGSYAVTVAEGRTTLYAKHKPDIASNRLSVCVRPTAAQCPSQHGRTIVGSAVGEGLKGTGGWDVIRGRGGNDHILIDDGGRDKVSCGGGHDTVRIVTDDDDDDEIAPNCEEIEAAT